MPTAGPPTISTEWRIGAGVVGPLPALAGVAAVCVAGAVLLPLFDFGPLSGHMVLHIAAMNAAAPLGAFFLYRAGPRPAANARMLWGAALAQLVLLWIWHLPAAQQAAALPAGLLAMHVTLFAAALAFWTALMRLDVGRAWQGVLALMLTGKLACLLAGLLLFAPRALYASHGGAHAAASLADQHLAGLLMLAACPLSYVVAGLVLTARSLGLLRSMSVQAPTH